MEMIVQQLQQYTPPETSYDEKYTTNQPIFTTNNIITPNETHEITHNMFQPSINYQNSSSFNTYLGHKDELLTPTYNNDSIFETGNHNDEYIQEENTSFSQTKELLPTEPIFEENLTVDDIIKSSSEDKIGNNDLPLIETILVGEYGSTEYLNKVSKELPSTEPIFEVDEEMPETTKLIKERPLRETLFRTSLEKYIPVVNLCSVEDVPSTEPLFDENALQETPIFKSCVATTTKTSPCKDLPDTEPVDDEDGNMKLQLPALIRISTTKELPSTEPCGSIVEENILPHSFSGLLNQQKDIITTEYVDNVNLLPTEHVSDMVQDEAIDLSIKVAALKDLESNNLDIDMPKEDDTVLINNKSAVVSIATTITVSQCQRNVDNVDDNDDDVQIIKVNKQPDEQALKATEDMDKLRLQLPKLDASMKLERKVGEGTFSSVYLATLRAKPSAQFAVKHLTPTCHPSRIKRELQCLRDIGGRDNVSGIHLCLRNQGCVVFVMPYQPHTRFHDYVLDMDAEEAKLYMKNLLIALRRVHSFGIIHRDVKPGNFLYDRENKNFLLVDFGLAQAVSSISPTSNTNTTSNEKNIQQNKSNIQQNKPAVQKNNPTKPRLQPTILQNRLQTKPMVQATKSTTSKPIQNRFSVELPKSNVPTQQKVPLSGRNQELVALARSMKRKREEDISENVKKMNSQNTEKSTKRRALQTQIDNKRNIILPFKPPASKPMGPQFQLLAPPSPAGRQTMLNMSSFVRVQNSRVKLVAAPLQKQIRRRCLCSGKGQICELCLIRPKLVAPRAGTPGFRPPEVLLKSMNQTTAVDMWAAGVLLLSILSGCYPFFRSPDDMTALAEVMTLLGSKAIKDTAKRLDRMFACDRERAPLDLQKLCVRLRTNRINRVEKKTKDDCDATEDKCSVCGPSLTSTTGKVPCLCRSVTTHNLTTEFPKEAYDLLYKLLDPNPDTRITAVQALDHPFLKE